MDGGYLVCATPPSVYWHYYINKNTGGGHKFFEFACFLRYITQDGDKLEIVLRHLMAVTNTMRA